MNGAFKRSLTRLAVGSAAVVTAALCAGLGFAGFIGTQSGAIWLEGQLESRISALTSEGRFEVGGLSVGRQGIGVEGLALIDASDRVLVSVDRVVADLDLLPLIRGRVRLPRARAEGVTIDLTADEDGVLDIVRLFGGPADPDAQSAPFEMPVDLELPEVAFHGLNLRYATPAGTALEIAGIDGAVAVTARGREFAVDDLRLAGQLAAPGPIAVHATGDLRYDTAAGLFLDGWRCGCPTARPTPPATSARPSISTSISRRSTPAPSTRWRTASAWAAPGRAG